jgi:phosphatidylglycerol lysyltransferase
MLRRLLFWILVIAFGWVIISRFSEIEKLATTLSQGRWQWVLAALLLQVLFFICNTWVYLNAFSVVGIKSRFRDMLPLTLAAVFVNSTAPSGGTGGIVLFVDDAKRHGQSAAQAAAGVLLVNIATFGSFLLILTVGFIILLVRHDLQTYELLTGLVMYLYVAGMTAVLLLGARRPAWLLRILEKTQRGVNRLGGWFRHPTLLREAWAADQAAEFEASARSMSGQNKQLLRAIALALLAHGINLACLYTLFLAFNVTATLGVVIAGYAMTYLFWIISPTPSGIGVVEGLMPVIYTSLGLDTASATIITLTFRGISFWLPFLIGFFLLRQLHMFGPGERSLARLGQVKLIAFLTGLMGILNVLSAVSPALSARAALLEQFSPLTVSFGGNVTAVVTGFALLILAYGLTLRKRTAWWLTLVVLGISIISHLLKGLDYEEAALAALMAIYLFWQRQQFQARSDQPSARRGLQIMVAAVAFTLLYGTIGFYLLDRQFSVNFDLWTAFRQTVVMFTAFYNPGLEPVTDFGHYFANSIYITGAATLLIGLGMFLRPVIIRQPATRDERILAQHIVEKYGRSSTARLLLLPDKAYWFSLGGSVVGYAVRGKTAVALGDPIGPAADVAAAISGFRDYCHQQGWQPAFYQTLPDYLPDYKVAGFEAIRTGHEAVVDLRPFLLDDQAGKPFRDPINKLAHLNYRADIVQPPLSRDLLRELREVNDEWQVMTHGTELRFSLGWFDDAYIGSSTVIVIRDEIGRVTAFATLVPEYTRREVSIGLMRHRHEIENGTVAFLIGNLLVWGRDQGYETFNLGLSSLSRVGEAPNDPTVEKAMHYVYDHMNQFYSFQGLHTIKEQFQPNWEPRYIVFPGLSSLPAVWSALARAGSGDGFVFSGLQDLPPKVQQMAKSVQDQLMAGRGN